MIRVSVIDRQRRHRIGAAALVRFLRSASRALPADPASVCLCLVSDRAMRRINRRHRGIDAPTDVLSFEAGRSLDPAERDFLGDVVVAVPTAARQAREAGHSLARELKLLALHGYLHLLGYDHETDGGTMRRLERRVTRQLLQPGARRSDPRC